MNKVLNILFIEDVELDADLIWHEIEKNKISFNKLLVDNKKDFLDGLNDFQPDLIISDYSLPHLDGMTALLLRNELTPHTPFLLVTGSINEEVAVECIKAGANDYILKENLSRLVPAIFNSIEKSRLTFEKKAAEEELLKSERRLQKAQAIAHVGNWELDLSANVVWCSDEAISIYGLDKYKHEYSYQFIKSVPLSEYRPALDEVLNNLLKYNEPYVIEFKIARSNDRSIRSIFSKAELEVEPDGEQVKVVGVIQDITDRKIAEEALAFNNLLLRTEHESAIDAILVVDDKNMILNFNQRFIDIWDIPKELLESRVDKPILEYVTERTANPKKFLATVEHIYKMRNETFHDEVILKDGRIIDRYTTPMFGQDQKYYGRLWYFRDITNRKWAENELRESEKRYRNIFENVQDVYYETTIDGIIIDISPSIELLSKDQFKVKELIGKSMEEFYAYPSERQNFRKILNEKGSVTDFEITLKNRDGSIVPCSISAKVNFNSKGKPEKIIGSVRNITDRKKAEETIRQERRMLRTLIDNLPDAIYVQDKEARKVIANKADLDNIGISNEADAIGKTDIELFQGQAGKLLYDEDMKVILSGKPIFDLEEEFIDRSGMHRWLQTSKIPLSDKDGNITGLVGIGHDITERKRVEEERKKNEMELMRAKEKAEESDRLKTAFLHNISHEIRTPMNAIVGFSALLGEPDIDRQSRDSYIEVIMQSSNHLLSIISDIVDISNIEANIISTTKTEVNLNSVIRSLCKQFSQKVQEKKIDLISEPGMSDIESEIVTDSTKLNQILSNLLGNAIKFTDAGMVKISYRLTENFIEFNVTDTGIGISPEHIEKIFDRFYQVQSSVKRLYEGTGLGLSISKAYIEHLGGSIWLSSVSGNGTTFTFTIPYEKGLNKHRLTEEKIASSTYVFPDKKVILVAEDVESNFKLVKYFLSGSNTEVLHAVNGKEAVDKCFNGPHIDLILMDIKMPLMDGYAAVRAIREKNSVVPIIAQTAYADDRDKAIECGCSGFISKPFDKKLLFKVLREFI